MTASSKQYSASRLSVVFTVFIADMFQMLATRAYVIVLIGIVVHVPDEAATTFLLCLP